MINCSKTEGMWIGSKRHYKEKTFGIKWPNEPIKALGVYFTITGAPIISGCDGPTFR